MGYVKYIYIYSGQVNLFNFTCLQVAKVKIAKKVLAPSPPQMQQQTVTQQTQATTPVQDGQPSYSQVVVQPQSVEQTPSLQNLKIDPTTVNYQVPQSPIQLPPGQGESAAKVKARMPTKNKQ